MSYFDINHFYKHGFALVEEFETEKKYIHQEMKNINWVENIYLDGDVYKVPDWVLANVTAEEYHSHYDYKLVENTPNNQFNDIFNKMIKDSYFSRLTRGQNVEVAEVDFYCGTSGLDWHFDGAKVPLDWPWFMMMYFNDDWEEWHKGQIEFGTLEWDLDVNPYDVNQSFTYSANAKINQTHSILPLTNTCLVGMNHNPRFVHRTVRSHIASDRYTLLILFKVI